MAIERGSACITRLLGLLLCFGLVAPAAAVTLRICHNQELGSGGEPQPAFLLFDAVAVRQSALDVEHIPMPWARCLLTAAQGDVDAVLGVSYNRERGSKLRYPLRRDGRVDAGQRMYRLGYVLVRPRGGTASWDGERFSGLEAPLGAQRGYSIVEFARAHGALVDDGNSTAEGTFGKLKLGRLSGVLVSQPQLRELQQSADWEGFERVGPLLLQKNYYLAFSPHWVRDHRAVAKRIWRAIRQRRQDEAFHQAFRLHVGGDQMDTP